MKTMIDWRLEICHFLQLDPTATDKEVFSELQAASTKIEEAQKIKQKSRTHQGPLRYQIVYHVFCHTSRVWAVYMKEPWTVHAGPSRSHLRGGQQVSNMQLYLERNKDVIFLVHRDYVCCRERYPPMDQSRPEKELDTMLDREYIEIVSIDLESKMASLSKVVFQGIPHPRFKHDKSGEKEDAESDSYDDEVQYRGYKPRDDLDVSYPYLWFYHRRPDISEAIDGLEEIDREHLNVFCGYIRTRMSDEWATVDMLISKGEIIGKYVGYVYVSLLTRIFVQVSYCGRFQERLSSGRPMAMPRLDHKAIWLQTGWWSHPSPCCPTPTKSFQSLSRQHHGVLTANSKETKLRLYLKICLP